jgi:murein DD-endopeptidase MepM/ murein hydrolase activator NlpD
MIRQDQNVLTHRLNFHSLGNRWGELVKKIAGANLTLMLVATSFLPNAKSYLADDNPTEAQIEEVNAPLITIKTVQYPLETFAISQGFSFFHPGVDMTSAYGSPIKPIKQGIVAQAGYSVLGYGNMVYIDHGNGITSLYAHLSKILVKKGDEVNFDTVLGNVGSTGHSTGPHLHLEIRDHEKPVNPFSVLPLPQP